MNFEKTVKNIGLTTELKRFSSAYVIDFRNLTEEELRAALIKTAPQYAHIPNVEKALRHLFLDPDRNCRLIASFILKRVLLHKDDFMCPRRDTEDEIISWEQSIVDQSNEDLLKKAAERSKDLSLFRFVVDTAWQHNDSISSDEKNLIEKIQTRLKITDEEHHIIEAKLGKFPKPGNELHTRGEIDNIRKLMQSEGLLFGIRDDDGTDFDVIPDEVAHAIREVMGISIRRYGYTELLKYKAVNSKAYLATCLKKADIAVDGYATMDVLRGIIIEQVSPSLVLGGVSPKDGLSMNVLQKWCADIGEWVSGTKADIIARIIDHYDNLLEREEHAADERELWYEHFEDFARRNLGFLRSQQLIEKDLQTETMFEHATSYLFEKKLRHKPLSLVGSERADGALSYQDKVIYWDNKSKESPVNLKDHIKQFDRYITMSEKPVAGFLVVGPDFTPESSLLAMQYQVENGTTICLVTAGELKAIAEAWAAKTTGKDEDPFPLGYLIQIGRFNAGLVAAL